MTMVERGEMRDVDDPDPEGAADPLTGEPTRRIPRSCSDVYRLWAAVGLGLVLTIVFYVVQAVAEELGLQRDLTPAELALEEDFGANLIGWVGFAIAYLWLGVRAFFRADHAELVRRIEGSPLPASAWRRWLLAGGGSLGWPVAISVWAFAAVITATLNRQDTPGLVLVFAALTVFSCAAVITFSFALHYARKDVTEGGLEFLGSDLAVFSDYLYVAIGGTVAFGPQDVMVVSSSMRRTVSVQTVLGWLLSTVIIAVLLSLVTS
jgi:uncharacterized membrane protein